MDEYGPDRRNARLLRRATAFLACLSLVAVAVSVLALLAARRHENELSALRSEVRAAERRVASLAKRDAAIERRVGVAQRKLARREAGIAPLARRVLRSVFTIETDSGLGTGFVAWRAEGATYLVTAAHVVEEAGSAFVTVTRKGGGWTGEIATVDRRNDLALIRVSGRPGGAEPLWQDAKSLRPDPGDQLLLVGSPFGLEGSVTTGVVSRVTKTYIQTDAAANPGNSGGPALDEQGRIVGVLISGGGQNVNFAVPIAKACVKLRDCA